MSGRTTRSARPTITATGRKRARPSRQLLHRLALLAALATLASCATASGALAAGDANTTTCPAQTETSPGFRSYLPDCRAFELVSPPYVSGQPPAGIEYGPTALISPDGEHLLSFDFAGFAGAENLEENATDYLGVYEFSRTPGGWSAEALNPPAAQYPRSKLALNAKAAAASTDLSRTLWELDLPTDGTEHEFQRDASRIAVREPAGDGSGKFTILGPAVSDPTYEPQVEGFRVAGTSSDLSHIFLNLIAGPHTSWPGDQTASEDPSLYEYQDREGHEPVLVGVSNTGPPAGTTHINEHAQLISDCGTTFDGRSETGAVVLFTAEHQEGCAAHQPAASELYARIDAEKTIDISEPPLEGPDGIPGRQCTAQCAEAEENTPAPATYRGSSADGTTVYFTSEQPLLNTATGGGPYLYEETLTSEGEASHASTLRLIATPVTGVAAVAKDGNRVYFESTAVLTAGPNANGEHAGEQAGARNLYSYTPTGPENLTFVAEDPTGARENGETTYASIDTTADGEYLLFASSHDIPGTADTSTAPDRQLFEYSTATRRVTRVSAGAPAPAGAECEVDQSMQSSYGCDGNAASVTYTPHMVLAPAGSLTEDGTVVFTSTLALTAQAAPSRLIHSSFGGVEVRSENIYEYRDGTLRLISPGDEAESLSAATEGEIRLYAITPGGGDILFGSTESLVPQDLDSEYSWYDARQNGGFPAPASPPECSGPACQPAGPAPPTFLAPASSTEMAGPNLAPPSTPAASPKPAAKAPPKCRRGYTRHHGKCVRSRRRNSAEKSNAARRHKRGRA